jgi:hypothetical protein
VQSARKSQVTLNEEISLPELHLPELHLPSLGAYFLVWMQTIAHWKTGVCNSSLFFSSLHQNTEILSGTGKSIKVTNVFILCQPRNEFTLIQGV